MPICERHTRYIPEGQYCGACWSEGVLTKKVEEKATKQNKSSLTKQKEIDKEKQLEQYLTEV